MIQSNANKFLLGAGAIVWVATVAVLVVAQLPAQAQVSAQDASDDQAERPRPAVKIGTYDPQAAFEKHPAQKDLMDAMKTAQAQMQQARQEGDQQEMQRIQQEYEQARQEAIQQFEEDIAKALPDAAKAANVKIVAMEIVYKDDDVKTTDVTPLLAKEFAE